MGRMLKRALSDKRIKQLAREAGLALTDALLAQVDRSSEAAAVKALARIAAEMAKKKLGANDPFEARP